METYRIEKGTGKIYTFEQFRNRYFYELPDSGVLGAAFDQLEQVWPQYDSKTDTLDHIKRVNELLIKCCQTLLERATVHDKSKLEMDEKEGFDRMTPKLKSLTYGSSEYKVALGELQEVLQHHYKHNSHHPEHYVDGVNAMDLFDVMEMLMDWKAATERHEDGDIFTSLKINKDRFHISDQLSYILLNTITNLKLG